MILGVGIDTIDIRRIEKAIMRFGNRFLSRIFTDSEIAKAQSRVINQSIYAASFAKRFAAKEAASKALGTGFRDGVYWRDLNIVNTNKGKPTIMMTGGAAKVLKDLTPSNMEVKVDLSITDEYPLAEAIVIISAF